MGISFTLLTIFEVALGVFFIWGFWNEEKLADFEDKLFEKMGIPYPKKKDAEIMLVDGTVLTHDKIIKDCGLQNGDTIVII